MDPCRTRYEGRPQAWVVAELLLLRGWDRAQGRTPLSKGLLLGKYCHWLPQHPGLVRVGSGDKKGGMEIHLTLTTNTSDHLGHMK